MVKEIAMILLLLLGLVCAVPTVNTEDDIQDYLHRFGYFSGSNSKIGEIITPKEAIKKFQKTWGLSQTGEADPETLKLINSPRCGNMDTDADQVKSSRKKRFVYSGHKWDHTDLTYKINNYTPDLPKEDVDKTIQRAFELWSEVSTLTFTRKYSGKVDIEILFASDKHGDPFPFKGPGGVLAHAFLPYWGGDAHFDEAERWTLRVRSGINLLQVAAHEFGHSLGLLHSKNRNALMAPFYRGYIPNFKLHSDDIEGIQDIYGTAKDKFTGAPGKTTTASPTTTQTPPTTTTTPGIPRCGSNMSPDAVTTTKDGRAYLFQGEYYYLLTRNPKGFTVGSRRKIVDDWRGLPSNLDAAVYLKYYGYTYFFKGEKYWKFRNKVPMSGYPRYIRNGFRGVPDNVDAAFIWSGNGALYFIKGSQYYRYSGYRVSRRYPKSLSVWRGLPSRVDAAFQFTDRRTYFFKGTEYYRFNDRSFKVDRKTWLRCTNTDQLSLMALKSNQNDEELEGDDAIDSENPMDKQDKPGQRSEFLDEMEGLESGFENTSNGLTSSVSRIYTSVHTVLMLSLISLLKALNSC